MQDMQSAGQDMQSAATNLADIINKDGADIIITKKKLDVKDGDTLKDVKVRMREKGYWGTIDEDQQCLSKGNKPLKDNDTLKKLGIHTGDTLHITDESNTCTHIFVTNAKEAKAITPTAAALRVLQNALHAMAKYASIGPVIIGVLMTAINMADQVSGVMSDHGFAAVHTPYISDAATELQSALFHGVHNHLFEREIGSYGPATTVNSTMPAWGSTDHARYSRAARQQEYRAFKTMHALGRFLGEVEIVLEAAKDTERDKLGAGTATWFWRGTKGLMAYVPLSYWYLRVLSVVEHHTGWACVRGAGKKASRKLVALTHAYNEDAHLVLTRELLAVTSRVSDTARDVRFPNARDGKWHSRSGRKRKAAYDDVVLPHCLHLHGGEMRAIGKSMLGPNPDQVQLYAYSLATTAVVLSPSSTYSIDPSSTCARPQPGPGERHEGPPAERDGLPRLPRRVRPRQPPYSNHDGPERRPQQEARAVVPARRGRPARAEYGGGVPRVRREAALHPARAGVAAQPPARPAVQAVRGRGHARRVRAQVQAAAAGARAQGLGGAGAAGRGGGGASARAVRRGDTHGEGEECGLVMVRRRFA
jgi:hypothetical protein